MSTVQTPKRGEIWLVDFDPSVGAEIRKCRPAVILNRTGVGRLPLQIVVPITDWRPAFAAASWFTFIKASSTNGLVKDSGADAFQVKSVSQDRLVRKVGKLESQEVDNIAAAVALCIAAP